MARGEQTSTFGPLQLDLVASGLELLASILALISAELALQESDDNSAESGAIDTTSLNLIGLKLTALVGLLEFISAIRAGGGLANVPGDTIGIFDKIGNWLAVFADLLLAIVGQLE